MSIFSKESWKKTWGQFINWNWAIAIILCVSGLMLVVVSTTGLYVHHQSNKIEGQPSPDFLYGYLLPFIKDLGFTIISAGFFAAFAKSFQFIGIFSEELRKVLKEDNIVTEDALQEQLSEFQKANAEVHARVVRQEIKAALSAEGVLTKSSYQEQFANAVGAKEIVMQSRERIQQYLFMENGVNHFSPDIRAQIWKNVTQSFYTPQPDIKEELLNKLHKFYVPDCIEYLQKNFVVKYVLDYKDNHVIYTEHTSYEIVPGDGDINLSLSYFVWKTKGDSEDKSGIEVVKFLIDDRDQKSKFKFSSEEEDGYIIEKNRLNLRLERRNHKVNSVISIRNTTKMSPHWRHVFSKFTKGFTIEVKNNAADHLNFKLELTDDRLDLRKILVDLPENKKIDELLLPSDGYLIVITPRKWI